MNGYHQYTPVRITVPFILGITWSLVVKVELSTTFIIWFAVGCYLGLVSTYLFLRTNFNLRWVNGLLASFLLFLTGAGSVLLTDQSMRSVSEKVSETVSGYIFICLIEESPIEKTKTYAGNAVVIGGIDSLGQWQALRIKTRLYFKGDSLCKSLSNGDLILVNGNLQTVPGPPNPHMFNYRQYLYNSQVGHQLFLDSGRWHQTSRKDPNPFKSGAAYCRNKFLAVFKEFRLEGQDFALVSALMFGSKEYLEQDTRQEFSHAGAMHVLCVSGLHVGIMYVVADKLLFLLKRGRNGKKVHTLLIICCIWAYAFITGLSASVVRAALMFSLIAAGKMFKRCPESFNILAVAAFFQLLINPYTITQVGFQLSYLAVLGIFAFYKPVNEMVASDNKLIVWTWSILAVSMAAQLATFPLASYYFNMFPVYFLVTNLIVVPLAAVIIYFAVFLLLAGAAGLTAEWLAWPLKWSLRFMQGSVEMIQSWPGAVIEQIVLSTGQVVLIYIAILALFAMGVQGKKKWVFVFIASIIIFSFISVNQLSGRLTRTKIFVYQVSGHTAIDLVHNRKALFIYDSLLYSDQGKIEFQIRPNRMQHRIKEIQSARLEEKPQLSGQHIWLNYPFIFFRGKTLVIIDEQWKSFAPEKVISCDLVVIRGNPRIKPEEMKGQINTGQIIIDSSVPNYKMEKFIQFFQQENVPCHPVRKKGAFILKW